jgi:hypothetical protein
MAPSLTARGLDRQSAATLKAFTTHKPQLQPLRHAAALLAAAAVVVSPPAWADGALLPEQPEATPADVVVRTEAPAQEQPYAAASPADARGRQLREVAAAVQRDFVEVRVCSWADDVRDP